LDAIVVPPHSIEAEQALLGGMMLDNRTWDDIVEIISEDDIYRHDHKLIFRAIRELAERSKPCDAVTISEELERQQIVEQTGGLAYLADLVRDTPSAANVKAYAEVVRERSVRRNLIGISSRIASCAIEPEGRSSGELIEDADRQLFELSQRGARSSEEETFVGALLGNAIDRIEMRQKNAGEVPGLETGFADIDKLIGGMQGGQLIVIAGRPGMGKSTLAVNIAENVSIRGGKSTCIYSMEMSKVELTDRIITSTGRVNVREKIDDEGWVRVNSAITALSKAPLMMSDLGSMNPSEIRARSRRLMRKHGLSLIVVDYLQLMHVPGYRENRTVEIGQISRSLKALAKELNIPIIALSQLNRGVEQRQDKRPIMSDLRDSGDIEQDADVIMLVYRDEYYDQDTPRKGIAEVIIAKQRNGPTGEVHLTFDGSLSRFDSFANSAGY
jgi:replicative DNA helicase